MYKKTIKDFNTHLFIFVLSFTNAEYIQSNRLVCEM